MPDRLSALPPDVRTGSIAEKLVVVALVCGTSCAMRVICIHCRADATARASGACGLRHRARAKRGARSRLTSQPAAPLCVCAARLRWCAHLRTSSLPCLTARRSPVRRHAVAAAVAHCHNAARRVVDQAWTRFRARVATLAGSSDAALVAVVLSLGSMLRNRLVGLCSARGD